MCTHTIVNLCQQLKSFCLHNCFLPFVFWVSSQEGKAARHDCTYDSARCSCPQVTEEGLRPGENKYLPRACECWPKVGLRCDFFSFLATILYDFPPPPTPWELFCSAPDTLGGRSLKVSVPVPPLVPGHLGKLCALSYGVKNQLGSLSFILKASLWDANQNAGSFALGGRTQPSLHGDREGKPWRFRTDTSLDHGVPLHGMTHTCRLWSASSEHSWVSVPSSLLIFAQGWQAVMGTVYMEFSFKITC